LHKYKQHPTIIVLATTDEKIISSYLFVYRNPVPPLLFLLHFFNTSNDTIFLIVDFIAEFLYFFVRL